MVVYKHCYVERTRRKKHCEGTTSGSNTTHSLPFTDRVVLFSSPRRATPHSGSSETFKLLCRVSASTDGCYIINHRSSKKSGYVILVYILGYSTCKFSYDITIPYQSHLLCIFFVKKIQICDCELSNVRKR
jgi:hypothetical protein